MKTKADIYFRFPDHGRDFSIRSRESEDYGKVRQHAAAFSMDDAQFVVRETGRDQVLREQQKNIHAFVRGTVTAIDRSPNATIGETGSTWTEMETWDDVEVAYNPYSAPFFYDVLTGQEVKGAEHAYGSTVVDARGRRHPKIIATTVVFGERYVDLRTCAKGPAAMPAACSI